LVETMCLHRVEDATDAVNAGAGHAELRSPSCRDAFGSQTLLGRFRWKACMLFAPLRKHVSCGVSIPRSGRRVRRFANPCRTLTLVCTQCRTPVPRKGISRTHPGSSRLWCFHHICQASTSGWFVCRPPPITDERAETDARDTRAALDVHGLASDANDFALESAAFLWSRRSVYRRSARSQHMSSPGLAACRRLPVRILAIGVRDGHAKHPIRCNQPPTGS
jgi:hypothetical protein